MGRNGSLGAHETEEKDETQEEGRVDERVGEVRRSKRRARRWWQSGSWLAGGEDPTELRRLEDTYGRLAAHQRLRADVLAGKAEREATGELRDDFGDLLEGWLKAMPTRVTTALPPGQTTGLDDATAELFAKVHPDVVTGSLGGLVTDTFEHLGEFGAEFLKTSLADVEGLFTAASTGVGVAGANPPRMRHGDAGER